MTQPGRDAVAAAGHSVIEKVDRRRPERPASVSPSLIPLLRDPAAAEIVAYASAADQFAADPLVDDLGPAKGIAAGLILAVPFWGLAALGVWAALK